MSLKTARANHAQLRCAYELRTKSDEPLTDKRVLRIR